MACARELMHTVLETTYHAIILSRAEQPIGFEQIACACSIACCVLLLFPVKTGEMVEGRGWVGEWELKLFFSSASATRTHRESYEMHVVRHSTGTKIFAAALLFWPAELQCSLCSRWRAAQGERKASSGWFRFEALKFTRWSIVLVSPSEI